MRSFQIRKLQFILLLFTINVAVVQAQPDSLMAAKEFSPRGGLPNFFAKINAGKPVKIAFLGGSITRAGNGYRGQILNWFKDQYPATQFGEIMAAVSGTGSDFGACRVKNQVIDYMPDLVFVEFAVNDNRWLMQFVRQTMEGIVRQIWRRNKSIDICFIYTFAAENLPLLQQNIFPPSVSAMETIAAHYNIPSIHVGLAVIDEINKGKLLMLGKKDGQSTVPLFSIDGVHPLPETGHKIYTQVLSKNLLLLKNDALSVKHVLPTTVENKNWSDAGMLSFNKRSARFKGEWHLTDSVTKGKEYYQLQPQVYTASSTDASLKVKFKGTRFGLADIMGPGTAAIEITIDNQPPRVINRFDAFSTYYRLNYFIISNLSKGKHTATIQLAPGKIDKEAVLKTRNTIVKDWKPYESNVMYVGAILY
jgi:hypothetical protein